MMAALREWWTAGCPPPKCETENGFGTCFEVARLGERTDDHTLHTAVRLLCIEPLKRFNHISIKQGTETHRIWLSVHDTGKLMSSERRKKKSRRRNKFRRAKRQTTMVRRFNLSKHQTLYKYSGSLTFRCIEFEGCLICGQPGSPGTLKI